MNLEQQERSVRILNLFSFEKIKNKSNDKK